MRSWLRGKRGGALIFVLITALVAGGLGWVTAAALRLEREQVEARTEAERDRIRGERLRAAEREQDNRYRLALSLLDSRVLPVLVQEENRPYNDYSALFASPLALVNGPKGWHPEPVLEPSPLVSEVLPDWVLLHFQAAEDSPWGSPQLLSPTLAAHFNRLGIEPAPTSQAQRASQAQLCTALNRLLPPRKLLTLIEERSNGRTTQERTLVPVNPGNALSNPDAMNNTAAQQPAQPPNAEMPNAQPPFPAQAQQGGRGGQGQAQGSFDDRIVKTNRAQNESRVAEQRVDQNYAIRNSRDNGEDWLRGRPVKPGGAVTIARGPLVRLWAPAADGQEMLILAREVKVSDHAICQGLVLNWPRLQEVLAQEIDGLFPYARFRPVHDLIPPHPERTLSALPIELDPIGNAVTIDAFMGAPDFDADLPAVPALGWTPLRVGLGLAWTAALVALLAAALGGWSLIDLSERRIRFVSAVTHELRTPLTTLRLYLDMLNGGLVTEEKQKAEYLQTLDSEADRLHRLIANVLDFSRLENQRPQLRRAPVELAGLLEQVHTTWTRRCQDAGKQLLVDNELAAGCVIETDAELVQQVLGNLIDNACKYSREAADPRIRLRAWQSGERLVLEVEDRGPGVPARERQRIFMPFRRGQGAEVIAGGVGLGLALAQRWANLLGGRLTLQPGADGAGACFRLELNTTV